MTEPASFRHPNEGRFEEFFVRDSYVTLKNYLYNYLERRRAIMRRLARQPHGRVVEIGCGLSPIVTERDDVVYTELSLRALRTLKRLQGRGGYVVADGTTLPFPTGALDYAVCSEVLEHVWDDQAAINELARIVRPGGRVYITVPHRQRYFAADDEYVGHLRRYEIPEMRDKLALAGLRVVDVQKVLGPLEKVTMWTIVVTLSALERASGRSDPASTGRHNAAGRAIRAVLRPIFKYAHRVYALLARLDAALAPRALATVVLFESVKPDVR